MACAVLVFAALTLDVGGGSAQAAKRRVGVSVNGTAAARIHAAIAKVLKHHGFQVVSPALGGDSEDAIAAASKKAKLTAVVVGEVKDGGKRLKVRVYGPGGDVAGESSWSERGGPKKLAAVVSRTLWGRVGGSLSKAHVGAPKGEIAPAESTEKAEAKAPAAEPPAKQAAADASDATKEEETKAEAQDKQDEQDKKDEKAEPESEAKDEAEPEARHEKKRAAEVETPEASERGAAGGAVTALDLSVGPRFLWRSYSWAGGTLTPYSVPHAPSFGAAVAWYPGAHVASTGWLANVGVAAALELTPGLKSKTADGTSYPTSASDFWVGVRGRTHLGPAEGALTLGGGQQSFIFHDGTGGADRANLDLLTDVKYTYGRAAVDVRVELLPALSLLLGGGLRYVFSAGDQNFLLEASSYLPKASVLGLEATAGVGYRFLSVLEARVGFDLRRYQITAGSNTYMATTGTDQYTTIWAALAFLLDGASGGASDEPPPEPKTANKTAKKKHEDEPDDGDKKSEKPDDGGHGEEAPE